MSRSLHASLSIRLFGAILFAALVSPAALAFRSGPPAGVSGSPYDGTSCMLCHGKNPGTGYVQIIGAPARYTPNQVYNLTVRISDPVQVGGGFQLTVETDTPTEKIGTLIVTDPVNTSLAEVGLSPEWIEHTYDGVANAITNWSALGNGAEYHLQWKAPATDVGQITFYAAGNAINNDFSNTGDIIYFTNVSAPFNNCPADLSGDGTVSAADLALLLGSWGPGGGSADLSGDGQVNSIDLAQLLGSWGPC